MLLPEDEVVAVYASQDDAMSWLDKIGRGQLVTPREHNAGIMGLAVLLDALADPVRTATMAVLTTTGPIYATSQYAGSLTGENGRNVGAVGFVPRAAATAVWWDTIAELAERLGSGYSIVQGQPPTAPTAARKDLYSVVGPAAYAAIPESQIVAGTLVREDAQASEAIARVIPTVVGIILALRDRQTPTVDPALAAWVTNVSALRQKERQSYRQRIAIAAAVVTTVAAGAAWVATREHQREHGASGAP